MATITYLDDDGLLALADVKRVSIDATTGSTAVVAGVPGRKIRVIGFQLTGAANTTAKWQTGSTDLTGLMTLANVALLPAINQAGWVETAVGKPLRLFVGGGHASGMVNYIEVPS